MEEDNFSFHFKICVFVTRQTLLGKGWTPVSSRTFANLLSRSFLSRHCRRIVWHFHFTKRAKTKIALSLNTAATRVVYIRWYLSRLSHNTTHVFDHFPSYFFLPWLGDHSLVGKTQTLFVTIQVYILNRHAIIVVGLCVIHSVTEKNLFLLSNLPAACWLK